MKEYIKGLFYEPGGPSLTRLLAMASFLVFCFVSIYMVVFDIDWGRYDTFASITGIGGLGSQVSNKFINSKYKGGE